MERRPKEITSHVGSLGVAFGRRYIRPPPPCALGKESEEARLLVHRHSKSSGPTLATVPGLPPSWTLEWPTCRYLCATRCLAVRVLTAAGPSPFNVDFTSCYTSAKKYVRRRKEEMGN